MPTAPHVFVIRADASNLNCDVWMKTTDRSRAFGKGTGGAPANWLKDIPNGVERLDEQEQQAFYDGERLAIPVRPNSKGKPVPVLTAVPDFIPDDADGFRPFVRAFFDAAQQTLHQGFRATKSRVRPLVAMLPIGAELGGGNAFQGGIMRMLIDEAEKGAQHLGADVALVVKEPKKYALIQELRRDAVLAALDDDLRDAVERLGEAARRGHLVPFMGAGISVSAGAPTWSGLLDRLSEAAELTSDERDEVRELDILDQAVALRQRFLQLRPDDRGVFNAEIVAATDVPRYGLAPALLGALDSEQAITLNYDRLFEMASRDGGTPRRVIPGVEAPALGDRWLLKLHGTVDLPETIVLTRDDYLGFDTSRAALSALVKATLMTRHLLFVGFGLSDDHFHEIMYDVRRARSDVSGTAGTAVVFDSTGSLKQKLWPELDFVRLAPEPDKGREVEIFLDALLCVASDSKIYLLDPAFDAGLGDADRRLRDAILEFRARLPADAEESVAWNLVNEALASLGAS